MFGIFIPSTHTEEGCYDYIYVQVYTYSEPVSTAGCTQIIFVLESSKNSLVLNFLKYGRDQVINKEVT